MRKPTQHAKKSRSIDLKKMEMNPFKPLIQFYEGFYEKKFYMKISFSKLRLEINLNKVSI